MQLARPAFAPHPKQFGKGRMYALPSAPSPVGVTISDEVKLFATTFLAGFVVVSVLIS